MFGRCGWRRSDSVETTSPKGNPSGNSRAHAFLITAPLSHTLWSTNTSRSFAVPRLRLSQDKGRALRLFNPKGHRDTDIGGAPSMTSLLADLWKKNVGTTRFMSVQSPHALEARVRQLHDRRNAGAAVRRDDVRVQHRGGQHGQEAARGLGCPEPQWNPLHHHRISKVLCLAWSKCFTPHWSFVGGDTGKMKN